MRQCSGCGDSTSPPCVSANVVADSTDRRRRDGRWESRRASRLYACACDLEKNGLRAYALLMCLQRGSDAACFPHFWHFRISLTSSSTPSSFTSLWIVDTIDALTIPIVVIRRTINFAARNPSSYKLVGITGRIDRLCACEFVCHAEEHIGK